MPFQFVCVRSSTAWDGPTGGSLALSTSTVIVCSPGVIAAVTSKTCGALSVSSQPQNVWSTHTRVFLDPLQEQRDPLAFPGVGNRHAALVPGRPLPVPDPREPVDALFVLLDALVVLVGGAGQLDGVLERLGKPLFRDTDVLGVESELPRPGQRKRRLIRHGGIHVANKKPTGMFGGIISSCCIRKKGSGHIG